MRKKVAEWRQAHPGSNFDGWLPISSKKSIAERPKVFPYELFNFYPEWPDKPYLSIPSTERRRRCSLAFTIPTKVNESFALKEVSPTSNPIEEDSDFNDIIDLEIDWRHSDQTLIKQFGKLITERRPPNVQLWKTKGMGRDAAQMIKQLKALGAWRLLKLMNWGEASELTAAQTDQPLFENQSAWIRARNQTEDLLAAFPGSRFIPTGKFG